MSNQQVNLKRPKRCEPSRDGRLVCVPWKKSLPFFDNSRGHLIHRVKEAMTFLYDEKFNHISVHYLCNNQTTGPGTFLAEPPENRLLCEVCEMQAKRQRLASADELVGHHVHVGRIRVERTCCQDQPTN